MVPKIDYMKCLIHQDMLFYSNPNNNIYYLWSFNHTMAGVLIHLLAALVSATVVYYMHFRFEFSLAIFVGNFIPDVLKFGFAGLVQGTFNLLNIERNTYGSSNRSSEVPANASHQQGDRDRETVSGSQEAPRGHLGRTHGNPGA